MSHPLAFLISILGSLAIACMCAVRSLHMFQMDSYLSRRYWQWLRSKPGDRILHRPAVVTGLSIMAAEAVRRWLHFGQENSLLLLAWLVYAAAAMGTRDGAPAKKPLEMTGRATRILWTARLLLVLAAASVWWLLQEASFYAAAVAVVLVAHAAPAAILAGNQLMRPVQTQINRGFLRSAQAKMRSLRPVVVGVAGSYGKTSTKYFIDTLLGQRYRTLKTPGNVNTQLGVSRIVNENLTAEHEVFLVEMGAYKRGEVKDVAELVGPKIGIVTSIGPEHFERFLSMENIEETNYELIAALPADGLAVFNCENEHCRKLANRTRHTRVMRYGLTEAGNDVWAEGVEHSSEGLRFTIVTRSGMRREAATTLVGRLNVLNILGAAAIALDMGVEADKIREGIAQLKPAPNRLEVKKGLGGTTIIDDSYNSNPAGAAEALYVLSQFRSGKRVLVTPGMIELGVLQEEKNEELGYQASQVCDMVVLVGPEQTRPLAAGLRRGGFTEEKLHVVKDLSEATAIFQRVLRPGDVILFENDLPDLYSE
ncbi:MAG: UDP-N-acetylmuramoyl-tripeptide--D-alanyl-D-alanine ligase [Acidimicrobiia bacterium]|nr:UDP-N-acetylmuramoyl-tripeptide--D-alanyl-D-alanine ligase [Acidimicrobiia bacterium]